MPRDLSQSNSPEVQVLAVSVAGAMKMIGAGHQKIYDLLAARELESFKIGKARRITTASIQAFVDRKVAEAAPRK